MNRREGFFKKLLTSLTGAMLSAHVQVVLRHLFDLLFGGDE